MESILATSTQPSSQKHAIKWIAPLLLFVIVFAGVIYYSRQAQKIESLQKTSSSEQDSLPEWTLYSNKEKGFSVKYPAHWRKVEGDIFGFGPAESGEDVVWTLSIYPSTTTTASIAEKIGAQFEDRIEKIEPIKHPVDNNAEKIIVTSQSQPEWENQTVVLKNANNVYVLSNGSVKDSTLWEMKGNSASISFDRFYNSFKIVNNENSDESQLEALGTVSGRLCAAPDGSNTGKILAKDTTSEERTVKKINSSTDQYAMVLSPGEYNIRFEAVSAQGGSSYAYYTNKKKIKSIVVSPGSTLTDIDLCDYGTVSAEYQQELSNQF